MRENSVENPTFDTVAALWLEQIKMRVRLSSYAQYKAKLEKNILPYFEGMRIRELSGSTVQSFYEQLLQEGYNGRYAADMLSQLKMVLRFAASEYGLPDPSVNTRPVKTAAAACREAPLCDEAGYRRLCEILMMGSDRTKAGILLTLLTGLRIGELCALRWSDIDLERRILTVRRSLQRVSAGEENGLIFSAPQGRAGEREIPLSPFLADFLGRLREEGDVFFLSGTDKPVEPRTMQYRLRALLKREGLPDLSFSQLRGLFISRSVNRGADLTALTEVLGNVTVQSAVVYCQKPTMDSKRRAVELVGEEVV